MAATYYDVMGKRPLQRVYYIDGTETLSRVKAGKDIGLVINLYNSWKGQSRLLRSNILKRMAVKIFDHSSCHTAMGDDALEVNRMNVKPGGKRPKMHDTT